MPCYECGQSATAKRCKDGEYRCSSCIALRARATRTRATKSWRLNNPDKVVQHRKNYHNKHWTEQYKLHYDERLSRTANRRALRIAVHDEDIDRRVVWGRDEGHCRIKLVCDGVFVPFEEMHLDHVIPLSKGGRHNYANVQTGCARCNLTKADRILEGSNA